MPKRIDQLAALAKAVDRAGHRPGGAPTRRPNVLANAFREQLTFIRDRSPLKFAITTRRAAKTYSVGLQMVDDSFDYPGATYLFVGLVREVARRIFWKDVLKDIDKRYQLGAEFNESTLTMRMPNGAEIVILGADANESERDKLLGGRYRLVCIDEAQSWTTDLRTLVEGVLGPAVVDLDGQIILTGTPGDLYQGFFREVTNGCRAGYISPPEMREPGWSGHTWTTAQNPFMAANWAKQIERLKANNPRVVKTKSFRQYYLGEWVVDESALVYRFSRTRNTFTQLPSCTGGGWHVVLGVDLGYSPDPTAFVLAAWHDWDSKLYFLRSWKQWQMDITSVVSRTRRFEEEVRARFGQDIETLIIDGSNKQAVAEMRQRHGVAFLPADKREKEDFIELMNDEFILGNLLVQATDCAEGVLNSGKKGERLGLVDEYETLIWDPKHGVPGKRKEHPACQNHLTDAALYAWRHCYQFLSKAPVPEPERGSTAWFEQQTEQWWQAELDELHERQLREREAAENEEPMLRTH